MNDQQPLSQTRSRWTLVLLAAIFIAPVLLAILFYLNPSWQPAPKLAGTGLSPTVAMPDFSLKTLEHTSFTLKDIQRKWSFIYIIDKQCDDACKLSLAKMRDARYAQGGEAQRVAYYLVFTAKPAQDVLSEEFKKEHPSVKVLYADGAGSEPFFTRFKTPEQQDLVAARRVYVLDPRANYSMYYDDGFNPLGIMQDLKRLLQSRIG